MRRPCSRLCTVLLAALAGGALAGCYQHVVRAKGLGAEGVDVYEPNLSEKKGPVEQIESAVWGDAEKHGKGKVIDRSPPSKRGG